MGDFLIKMHINKIDPKIRKKQADQLAIQGLFLVLILLSLFWGFPLWGREGTGTELLWSSAET